MKEKQEKKIFVQLPSKVKSSVFIKTIHLPLLAQLQPPPPLHPPVVDVEQPVETHVDAEWDVHQDGLLLLQSFVHGGQAVDHLHHIHHVLALLQLLLPKHLPEAAERHQIHCKQSDTDNDTVLIRASQAKNRDNSSIFVF